MCGRDQLTSLRATPGTFRMLMSEFALMPDSKCRVFAMRCLLGLVCALTHGSAIAHPRHSSIAEVEWNAKSGKFEVSLRMNSFELEAELSGLNSVPFSIERTEQAEAIVRKYVEQRFRIATDSHSKCQFHWVGMELERLDLWAYFELQPRTEVESAASAVTFQNLRIYNALLMTVHPEQINLVNVIDGDSVRSSHHSAEAPEASPEQTPAATTADPSISTR